ncbi:hypothetical protein JAF86_004390 [Citrobacter braakii]|uniref:hypothetical protein n=1 Tax=Citrobacter sp. Cb041 TaxID=2985028 RepID=UPI00257B280C|nr:hypothetical protein [Citrobacter sp. Cb041]EGT0678564.1 hypothetical protein [Citrobacter braakii]ELK7437509.1 hypothetical protein [Citrobacter braakii]MDM3466603.1 hypothetical protein [Citrobacter sp. Cb041]
MTQQRIIINGSGIYEVSGLAELMKAEGYDVRFREDTEPTAEDILIMALSDAPLLNWWEAVSAFFRSNDAHRCQTLFLVPEPLGNIQKLFATVHIIDGSLPPTALKESIKTKVRVKLNVVSPSLHQRQYLARVKLSHRVSRRPLWNNTSEKKELKRYYNDRRRLLSITGMPNKHVMSVMAPSISVSSLMAQSWRM